jgi:hypothetical protein
VVSNLEPSGTQKLFHCHDVQCGGWVSNPAEITRLRKVDCFQGICHTYGQIECIAAKVTVQSQNEKRKRLPAKAERLPSGKAA